MRESIDLSIDEMVSNNFYNIYFGEKSLTWYRGYYYHDMTDKQLNKLLDIDLQISLNTKSIMFINTSKETDKTIIHVNKILSN